MSDLVAPEVLDAAMNAVREEILDALRARQPRADVDGIDERTDAEYERITLAAVEAVLPGVEAAPAPARVLMLGRYRDTVTGFEGVATGRWEKASGTVVWSLERLDGNGQPASSWFGEYRLEPVDAPRTGF